MFESIPNEDVVTNWYEYGVYVVDQMVFDEDHNDDTYDVHKDELALKAA